MGILKSILRWESSSLARAATDQTLIELQAKRAQLLFEALKNEGFTEDQAVQIVSGLFARHSG